MERTRLSLMFFIKKSNNKLLKNGEAPLYAKLTSNKKSTEFSLKRSVKPELWDTKRDIVKGKSKEAIEMNDFIDSVRYRIKCIQREFIDIGKSLDVQLIKNEFLGIGTKCESIIDLIQKHNDKAQKLIGIEYVSSTIKKFDTMLSKLKLYMSSQLNVTDISVKEINHKFIIGFEQYLKEHGCQHNSAMKYIKILKKILKEAIANDIIKKDPFLNYKITEKKVQREVLTDSELNRLIEKEYTIQRLNQVKDIFIFQCFTGLAYNDVKKLTRDNIEFRMDGTKQLNVNRTKTNQKSRVMLLQLPLDIIDKYKDHPTCIKTGNLLPVLSNQKMNAYLKEIADTCGISKKLTTHIARHTFATTLMLNNNMPIEVVSAMLGHTKLQTTQIYAKVTDDMISEHCLKLSKRLSGL